MTEIWKDVIGYENLYKISNYGRLKSSYNKGSATFVKGRIDKKGYRAFQLYKKAVMQSLEESIYWRKDVFEKVFNDANQ